jgi:hypothetical protein
VSAGAGIISDPDAKVFDFHWSLFLDLVAKAISWELVWWIDTGLRTTLRVTISPFDFLTFRNFIKKYQNRDLATTEFGANMRMR